MKTCDNTSVGAIILDQHDRMLVFDRNTDPPGVAGPAGHIDHHPTRKSAIYAEVSEEVGLTVVSATEVAGGWRHNQCRRQPGPRGAGHSWYVYRVEVTGDLNPSARETRNARWLDQVELQKLTHRTLDYAHGALTPEQFRALPGIEPVWVRWLHHMGLVYVTPNNLDLLDQVAADPYGERTTA